MAKPRKSYYWWIIGKLLYGLVGLAILIMVLFLLWRVYFSDNVPREMEGLVPNEALAAAYATHGEGLVLQTQEQATVTKGEKNYGYFAVPEFVYIPEAAQMQVLFRYNNSTLKATAEDFSLPERPTRGTEVYDVSLAVVKDLTPDDLTDNKDGSEAIGKERVLPTSHAVTTTSLYTYFIYTFDNVTITEDVLVVYFDVYYGAAVDYGATPYGTLRLYHRDSVWVERELTGKEQEALDNYGK